MALAEKFLLSKKKNIYIYIVFHTLMSFSTEKNERYVDLVFPRLGLSSRQTVVREGSLD